ncbi:MAG: hypothetical protein ACP5D9_19215 [Mariniphaga sp.]
MKTFEEDKELKQLLKSIKLESPGADFSARVMNRVFAEQPALEQVKSLPVFGKGFWVILALFAILLVAVALVSGGSSSAEQTPALLQQVNTDAVLTGYRSFFDKLASLPSGIAGIFMGASLLILLEKFLGTRSHAVV